jgi:ATP-dependent Clp protease adapter protein ClpS
MTPLLSQALFPKASFYFIINIMKNEELDEYEEPKMYRIVLIDKFTGIDPFLDAVLMDFFNKSLDDTFRLSDEIKLKGKATVGSYIWDIAITKARDVLKSAKTYGSTLQCMLLGEDNTRHKVTYIAGKSNNQSSDPNSIHFNTYDC